MPLTIAASVWPPYPYQNVPDFSLTSAAKKTSIHKLLTRYEPSKHPHKSRKSLKNLYLGKTLVSDLSFVRELPSLQLLSFVFSKVTTLIELHLALVLGSTPRLEKVYAFGNELDVASHAFAAALRNAGVEVQM